MGFPLLQAVCTLLSLFLMGALHAGYSRMTGGGRKGLYALPFALLLGFTMWNALFIALGGSLALAELLTGYSMFGFIAVGYLELFLNLYRGFSYTIVADIAERGPVTEETLRHDFAGGLGENGMIERRYGSMIKAGLIKWENGNVTLMPRGKFFASISIALRSFMHLEKGGGELPANA